LKLSRSRYFLASQRTARELRVLVQISLIKHFKDGRPAAGGWFGICTALTISSISEPECCDFGESKIRAEGQVVQSKSCTRSIIFSVTTRSFCRLASKPEASQIEEGLTEHCLLISLLPRARKARCTRAGGSGFASWAANFVWLAEKTLEHFAVTVQGAEGLKVEFCPNDGEAGGDSV